MMSVSQRLATQEFLAEYLLASAGSRYVLGTNEFALSVADAFPVDAFIDDALAGSTMLGRPVVELSSVPQSAVVINASLARTATARDRLTALGVRNHDYIALDRFSTGGGVLKQLRRQPWPEWELDYFMHRAEFDAVRARLSDSTSVEVFDALLDFRLTGALDALSMFRYDLKGQYFEDFLDLKGERFFDVGAFDGLTTALLEEVDPDFESAVLFEPDPENFQTLHDRYAMRPQLEVLNAAVGAVAGTARFESGMGSSSHLSATGGTEITVRALDEWLDAAPSFVKMDIEGGEIDALRGAEQLIRSSKPKLAICVYHEPDHIWRIPQMVFGLNPDYRFSLRHYTEGQFETVAYFY